MIIDTYIITYSIDLSTYYNIGNYIGQNTTTTGYEVKIRKPAPHKGYKPPRIRG